MALSKAETKFTFGEPILKLIFKKFNLHRIFGKLFDKKLPSLWYFKCCLSDEESFTFYVWPWNNPVHPQQLRLSLCFCCGAPCNVPVHFISSQRCPFNKGNFMCGPLRAKFKACYMTHLCVYCKVKGAFLERKQVSMFLRDWFSFAKFSCALGKHPNFCLWIETKLYI